jgi:hypothetical protein
MHGLAWARVHGSKWRLVFKEDTDLSKHTQVVYDAIASAKKVIADLIDKFPPIKEEVRRSLLASGGSDAAWQVEARVIQSSHGACQFSKCVPSRLA